jgi:hypothetical protein
MINHLTISSIGTLKAGVTPPLQLKSPKCKMKNPLRFRPAVIAQITINRPGKGDSALYHQIHSIHPSEGHVVHICTFIVLVTGRMEKRPSLARK